MFFPPGTITWFHRISLSLVRITGLFLIPLASAAAQGVCDRTPQVRDRLVQAIGVSTCSDVTADHLAALKRLSVGRSGVTMLQEGDFDGLISLEELGLTGNRLTTVPKGIFQGLSSLKHVSIGQNILSSLPEEVFRGLDSLQGIYMAVNQLGSLPEGVFEGLGSLQELHLDRNNLNSLPEDIFHGLDSLQILNIYQNNLSSLPRQVFQGLGALQHLNLNSNALSSLPEEVFRGLGSLQGIYLSGNQLGSLPDEIFRGLSNLISLQLGRNRLATLSAGIFDGLGALQHLVLYSNQLITLPDETFRGLSSLEELYLNDNRLTGLPEGIFRGLAKLEVFWLSENNLTTLPVGVFNDLDSLATLVLGDAEWPAGMLDEVLDTLGGPYTEFGGSSPREGRMDLGYRSWLAFAETWQKASQGDTIKAEVTLSRALPMALHVPYTVSGSVTPDDYRDLSPSPSEGLLFLAGETRKEINVTFVESGGAQDKDMALTLGDLSEIGFRRSDGSGPDAPHLRTISVLDRSYDRSTHHITVTDPVLDTDICGRTPQVRDKLIELTGASTCEQVTRRSMANNRIWRLELASTGITTLREGDFDWLSNLLHLQLHSNQLTTLPEGVFRGLENPTRIELQYNDLTNLPAGVFNGLSSLQFLYLYSNQLSTLPTGIFRGLSSLPSLSLGDNQLTTLPLRVFDGLSSLQSLTLSENQLTTLPAGIFDGLSSLQSLRLHSNQLATLPESAFSTLSNLTLLTLSNNALTNLPEGIFRGHTSLQWLYLNDNQLTTLTEKAFNGLSSLRLLHLHSNQLAALPEEIFRNLASLRNLSLNSNQLTTLPAGNLHGLGSLTWLYLSDNQFSTLPEEVFSGLSNLQLITLGHNSLTALPGNVFSGLDELAYLGLEANYLLGELPPGVFDDVLDTLGGPYASPRYATTLQGELSLDTGLKASLNFASTAQQASEGNTVRVAAVLSRPLPVAVRVPYYVGGSATADDYKDLSPSPSEGLLFLAGETRKEIVFSLLENKSSQGKTVTLTLGDLSEIGLRRSDGSGPDAPYLKADAFTDRPFEEATHTVTITDSGSGGTDPDAVENLFVPVLLTAAGRNNSFFTSELTLTNRGSEPAILNYTYTTHPGDKSYTATDMLGPLQQKIEPDAIDYLRRLEVPIPERGSQVGTLKVDVTGSSEVAVVVRTTTAVPEGRAGLAYLGIPGHEGFQDEAVYLCGLRQNQQDRSNVALQNMGGEGEITLRTTVFSGNAADTIGRMLEDQTLGPGEFHQFNAVMADKGDPMFGGYVRVERVKGKAPFYAYGVINDQANSDGSFIFPVSESSLAGAMGQTLPVVIEVGPFTSELTVTNFSDEPKTVSFSLVADAIETEDDTVTFNLPLLPGQQYIIPNAIDTARQQFGINLPSGLAVPLFATADNGDMSGIVIGARTGSLADPGDVGRGQYSVFYTAVPQGAAFAESAWVDGLQQNEENRSNLALVNTGEVDDSDSVFSLEIYDGETAMLVNTVSNADTTVGAKQWHQINGILRNYAPGTTQGYVRIRKVSGSNPFLAYGVVNDGGIPRQRSDDGAYIPARE